MLGRETCPRIFLDPIGGKSRRHGRRLHTRCGGRWQRGALSALGDRGGVALMRTAPVVLEARYDRTCGTGSMYQPRLW